MLKKLLYIALFVSVVACTEKATTEDIQQPTYTSEIAPFSGELSTKSSVDGLQFENGDRVRLHIVCPFSSSYENGETSGYQTLTLSSGVWTSGSIGNYQYQATTYVYTAIYSPMTRKFVWNNTEYTRLSNNFYADQSDVKNYKKCDLLWAQAFRQTGARNVHLVFEHKIARLDILVDDSALDAALSENTVLTLEGMPDIDGAEIVVGDYYASDSYGWDENSRFNYKEKANCTIDKNGTVLGIEVLDDDLNVGGSTGHSRVVSIDSLPQDAVYTAYHDHSPSEEKKHFLLIVPPCTLNENAVFWLRDGSRRYKATLDQTEFEEGVSYTVEIVL